MKTNERRTLKEILAKALLKENSRPRTIAGILGEDEPKTKIRHWTLEEI